MKNDDDDAQMTGRGGVGIGQTADMLLEFVLGLCVKLTVTIGNQMGWMSDSNKRDKTNDQFPSDETSYYSNLVLYFLSIPMGTDSLEGGIQKLMPIILRHRIGTTMRKHTGCQP